MYGVFLLWSGLVQSGKVFLVAYGTVMTCLCISFVVQVLHDAFFKYQTKPKLTAHGDLYHEGKEFEV